MMNNHWGQLTQNKIGLDLFVYVDNLVDKIGKL